MKEDELEDEELEHFLTNLQVVVYGYEVPMYFRRELAHQKGELYFVQGYSQKCHKDNRNHISNQNHKDKRKHNH